MYGAFLSSDSVMFLFFFFQAEDGIRDRNVTGVQTCALPISINTVAIAVMRGRLMAMATVLMVAASVILLDAQAKPDFSGKWVMDPPARPAATGRSEERRVGKECRPRGSRDDEKEK